VARKEVAITSSVQELAGTMKTISGTAISLAARQSAEGISAAAMQGCQLTGSLAVAAATKDFSSTAQVSGTPISVGFAVAFSLQSVLLVV